MYKIIGGDHKEYGPVNAEQIRQWIAEGRASAQTQVQAEGSADWRPLSAYPEFMSAPVPLTPPAPPVPPPGAIKVFGILNIIFGSLGLLCMPLSLIGYPVAAKQFGDSPLMVGWLLVSTIVSLAGSVVMLASGIGLCKLKSWARKFAVYYAVFACFMSLIGVAVVLNTFSTNTAATGPERIGGMVGGVLGALFGITYNILLVVFLTKRPVKDALGEAA